MSSSVSYTRLSNAAVKKLFSDWQHTILSKAQKFLLDNDTDYTYNLFCLFNILSEAEKKRVTIRNYKIENALEDGPEALSRLLKSQQNKTHGFEEKQKRQIDHASLQRKDIPQIEQLFNGQERIYLKPEGTLVSDIQAEVTTFLSQGGYNITDYKKGYATDEKGKQTFKIGKLLKGNKKLFDAFSADSARTMDNMLIVISRNTMDIARMSTNRAWPSCMSSHRENFYYVPRDIKHGTIIAYMISENDPHIHYPFARLLIKPFTTYNIDEKRIIDWTYNNVNFLEYSPAADMRYSFVRYGIHIKNFLSNLLSNLTSN